MTRIDAAAIDALLPQTQCTRCGFSGCRPYAEALAAATAELNRCPPGGARLIAELAVLLDRAPLPLDPACGTGMPPRIATIIAADCTGCARCLAACPVDAIIGARRQLHTVLSDWCTGCERCLPACPVDSIRMRERPPGSAAAPAPEANRGRCVQRQQRLQASATERARLLAQRKRSALGRGVDPP